MKKIEPLKFADARKLGAAEMNAIHFETGRQSPVPPVSATGASGGASSASQGVSSSAK